MVALCFPGEENVAFLKYSPFLACRMLVLMERLLKLEKKHKKSRKHGKKRSRDSSDSDSDSD